MILKWEEYWGCFSQKEVAYKMVLKFSIYMPGLAVNHIGILNNQQTSLTEVDKCIAGSKCTKAMHYTHLYIARFHVTPK